MNCSKVGPISARIPTRNSRPAGTKIQRARRLKSASGNSVSMVTDDAAIERATHGCCATQSPQLVQGSPSEMWYCWRCNSRARLSEKIQSRPECRSFEIPAAQKIIAIATQTNRIGHVYSPSSGGGPDDG